MNAMLQKSNKTSTHLQEKKIQVTLYHYRIIHLLLHGVRKLSLLLLGLALLALSHLQHSEMANFAVVIDSSYHVADSDLLMVDFQNSPLLSGAAVDPHTQNS